MTGRLIHAGWGAAEGYPGIILDDRGDEVQGLLFTSESLDKHWASIDEFEGDGYERVLISAKRQDGTTVDAYIYQLSGSP